MNFFRSVGFLDWLILIVFFVIFQVVYTYAPTWSSRHMYHLMMLFFWVAMAALYCLLITLRMGNAGGVLFLNGYILELVFLVENVLLCNSILVSFGMPAAATRRALHILVNCRVVFQMFFYMGPSHSLFGGPLFPYILGVWLLWVAVASATAYEPDDSTDVTETRVVYAAKFALGGRLSLTSDKMSLFETSAKDSRIRITLVGFVVCALVVSDTVFYIDVILTKMELLYANAFICFGSACAAAFAMPSMVFVTRDLFRIFPGAKYGFTAILLYISMQMFLHSFWRFPLYADVAIWACLLILSAVLPLRSYKKTVEASTQAGRGLSSEDHKAALGTASKHVDVNVSHATG